MTMTKTEFLAQYRDALLAEYSWTSDTGKLNRFMANVAFTIGAGPASTGVWNHDSPTAKAVFKVATKQRYSLKALRALPL